MLVFGAQPHPTREQSFSCALLYVLRSVGKIISYTEETVFYFGTFHCCQNWGTVLGCSWMTWKSCWHLGLWYVQRVLCFHCSCSTVQSGTCRGPLVCVPRHKGTAQLWKSWLSWLLYDLGQRSLGLVPKPIQVCIETLRCAATCYCLRHWKSNSPSTYSPFLASLPQISLGDSHRWHHLFLSGTWGSLPPDIGSSSSSKDWDKKDPWSSSLCLSCLHRNILAPKYCKPFLTLLAAGGSEWCFTILFS